MVTVRALAAAGVLLLAAGCSSGSSTPTPTPTPVSPVASSPVPTESAAPCPDGAYLIAELDGRGQASSLGKGTGGNIGVAFDSGTFTISSDGTGPVKLDIGPASAEGRFNGAITGTYEGDPSALRLTTTEAHGEVTVKTFGITRSRSAGALANQLIGSGVTATVTCNADGSAVLVVPNASLTLVRAGR